ncbi:GPS domain-containing protein [Caenorhabditis elegans]|uniref:GPS domain-containing protein n=1 Tax=Caenorhabditis elegans TaxID=6239 RepID=Q19931_CAEEL|nr:GPS domain-containing protein [Caenorhabditis elegans]AAQ84881.1 methuselah-like protein MTH-1 [Caenorhabditis elegans]CCD64647.2 GPS domain-containing protein [Caenorhabditis elegans]
MRSTLLSILLISSSVTAQNLGFTVTLTEQPSELDNFNQKYIVFFVNLECGADNCAYQITINNYAWNVFKVLINNKQCLAESCVDSFERGNNVNVTVHNAINGNVLRIFDLEFKQDPNVVLLGCETGFFNDGTCTRITDTAEDQWDQVCFCANSQSSYCSADQSIKGECASGTVTWWNAATGTTDKTTSVAAGGTTNTPKPFTFLLEDVNISLKEGKTKGGSTKDVILSAHLSCEGESCEFTSTISNYAPDYYTIHIGTLACQLGTCSGNFVKGEIVPILVRRGDQHLNMFSYQWIDEKPEISILGCNAGLLLFDTCLRTVTNPVIDFEYYDDTVCSCQGNQVTCDYQTQIGNCIGGTPTWWIDDTTSTSLVPAVHTTTAYPVRDPNVFDVTFLLSEGVIYDDPHNDHNVTITAFMNCTTTTTCQYSIAVVDYAQVYYTILVNGVECPGSVCSSTFAQGETVRVTVTRLGEQLDLFDLQNDYMPNIVVLGCSFGMVNFGICEKANYYDNIIQRDDNVCICQGTSMKCDADTRTGGCSDGSPTWWKPIDPRNTASSPSTTDGYYLMTFDTNFSEITLAGTIYQLSINTYLLCNDRTCTYQLKVSNDNSEYFGVYVNNQICQQTCESSFTNQEGAHVYIRKSNEILDLIQLNYKSVTMVYCDDGWLEPGKCIKTSNDMDTLCTCQGTNVTCNQISMLSPCSFGNPIWWQPIGLPTITTASPIIETDVEMTFTEELTNQNAHNDNFTVSTKMSCQRTICHYEVLTYTGSPDYFTFQMNGDPCINSCKGVLNRGELDDMLTVHRLGQHLNLIEFQFSDTPKLIMVGCEVMHKIGSADDSTCLQYPTNSNVGQTYFNDNLCVCKGNANLCDDNVPQGICTLGSLIWWQDDEANSTSTVNSTTITSTTITSTTVTTSSPSTSTVTTTTPPSTTTQDDVRNHFLFDISLVEGKNNSMKEVKFTSIMTCSPEECEYSIKVDNSAQSYFDVMVGNLKCKNKKCDGSFMKGQSINVTIYRGEQVLDLFDFEYTDIPRIVVLGCEDGLSEYHDCISTTTALDQDLIDSVCSCRSARLNCTGASDGVCRQGSQKWWKELDETTIPTTQTTSTPVPTTSFPSLKDISDTGVGLNNVTRVLNETYHYSSEGENLNRTQIRDITKILHNSANLAGISAENAQQILANMDQVLNAHRREIRNGQSKDYRLLALLRPMVMNTKDHFVQYLNGRNLGFNAKKVDCKSITTDDGLIDYGPDFGFAPLNDTNRLTATKENSIIVPLDQVCSGSGEQVSHVFFTIYRHQKLFSGPQKYRNYGSSSEEDDEEEDDPAMEEAGARYKRDTGNNNTDDIGQIPAPSKCSEQISIPFGTPVLSASIIGGDQGAFISRMSKLVGAAPVMAKLQFNVGQMSRPLHGNTIVSWFNTGTQEWELQQKCDTEVGSDGIVTASCEHLTDFSVLVYSQPNAEYVCSMPLTIIGYSVNGASIVCLLLLILIGLMFYIRGELVRRVLIYIRGQAPTTGDVVNLAYYCVFFLFFILSLFFMDQSGGDDRSMGTSTYCVVIAAMSYFSLISAIMMSMLIGLRMVCHFFSPKLRLFFGVMTSPPAALSIGLIVPFTFTLILALVDTSFFKRDDCFCWVRPDYIVYAVVIPVVLPIINGVICSSFAIYKMFFQAKRGLASKETSHYDAEFWSKVMGLIIMQVAMGLPWGIEFILIGVAGPSPWNYIFVLLLGTQGIDLFLIFLYRRQRLRNESRKWSSREEKWETKRSRAAEADED